MQAITRYILMQIFMATVFVTVGLTFAIWLTRSLRLIDFIVNRGLPASTFFAFVGLLVPSFMGIVLPIATFVAVLFVYNKLTMDSELVVLRAAGLSQLGLARPGMIMAAGSMLVVYSISLYFLPLSYRAFKDLQYDIRNDYSAVLLQEGVFNNISDDITVYVRERTSDGQMWGILVHDNRDRERPVTMLAESGALVSNPEGPRVIMRNGNRQEIDRDSGNVSFLYFDSYTVELANFTETIAGRWRDPKERFLHELWAPPRDALDEKHRQQLIAEGHYRLVWPLNTFAFALVGLAALLTGEFNRRGQAWRVVVAILCVAALEASDLALHDLADRAPEAIVAMYAVAISTILGSFYFLLRRPRHRSSSAIPGEAAAQ
jgi:lipopolysaccharide export system permease protein